MVYTLYIGCEFATAREVEKTQQKEVKTWVVNTLTHKKKRQLSI